MTHDEWWQIVEDARAAVMDPDDSEAVADQVLAILTGKEPAEIVAFARTMSELISQSRSVDLWGAAYTINGGASDDGFEYFRGWLLTQGRQAFEQVVADPDSLAGLPAVFAAHSDEMDLECEDMLGSAWDAYREVTGEDMPAVGFSQGGTWRELGPFWDFEDDEELERRLPRLAALYSE